MYKAFLVLRTFHLHSSVEPLSGVFLLLLEDYETDNTHNCQADDNKDDDHEELPACHTAQCAAFVFYVF